MDQDKVKLGIAPIAWTNDDLPDLGAENTFEQCISEMALSGFAGCEVGNKYPRDVETLKKALSLRGLCICNAWFSAKFTSEPINVVLEKFISHRDFLHAMGAKVIGAAEVGNSIQGLDLSIFDNKPIYTKKQWADVSAGFNEMAKLAEEKEMRLACHHHMGTGVQTEEEVEHFMETTDDNVWLLFDSGHFVYSEGNEEAGLRILKKYIHRTAHVHLKDIRPEALKRVKDEKLSFLDGVRLGTFTVPGDGFIKFEPIFDILQKNNYAGWMVVEAEQDPAKANPLEYALKARKYIREKTGL